MITQRQADEASKLCDRALSLVEEIQRALDTSKEIQAEFDRRMAEQNQTEPA